MVGRKPSIKNGDKFLMKENGWLEVVSYRGSRNIHVKFLDTGYETRTEAVMLQRGTVKDYLKKDILGAACLGIGDAVAHIGRKATWTYCRWFNIITRCFDKEWHEKKPTYSDCTVVDEWLNFQNFAAWAKDQYGYKLDHWQVDKDILLPGNREYGPETCCFVPNEINSLFKGRTKESGLPLGVSKVNNKYRAKLSEGGSSECLASINEALARYKKSKEVFIKQQAEKWKDKIDPRAYEALTNYQVEITD